MARIYRFVVGAKEAHLRLDRYLVGHLPQTLSRAVVQRAIEEGTVMIGGRVAKAHRLLKAGEAIVAQVDQLPAPSQGTILIPEPIPLPIVYEDDQMLVVNKPPGLVSHPAPGHWSGTLVNAILWHLQAGEGLRVKGQGVHPLPSTLHRPLPRAGIVHRLDKDTSGLLVVAKTELALRLLAKQLKARSISRRYLALVEGIMPADEGTIEASIGRHLKDRKRMTVRYLGGRQAVTHYRVLKRFQTSDLRGQTSDRGEGTRDRGLTIQDAPSPFTLHPSPFSYTLLEVQLETGRTHQVRVHLAHLGHPVLGDPVYSQHPASFWMEHRIPRQLLHAYAIRVLHPTRCEPVELTAELPEDMAQWVRGVALNLNRQ